MKVHTLLTAAARRHIRLLAQALRPHVPRVERRFRAMLREDRYDATHVKAILAITPLAAVRARTLPQFFEDVAYHGRRLALLNLELEQVEALLVRFNEAIGQSLEGSHAPALEQLHLATAHALQIAWYRVREGEAQVFYGLAHAEAQATDLDDLLVRMVRIVTRAFRARAGRLVLLETPGAGKPTGEIYTEEPLEGFEGHAATWSFPVRSVALLQLGFHKPYPWLPREQTMLATVSERCAAAIERARLHAELVRLDAEARCAEEDERRRIGRELHDDTAQSLLLLRLELEMMERDASAEWRDRLVQARSIAENAIEDLRRTIAALSPALLDRLGLESALRQLATRFAKRHPAAVDVALSPRCGHLAPDAQQVVYRVAQESLQNILKHSSATRVILRLSSADKKIRLSVRDNGAGFSPEPGFSKPMSFGLAGMRDRAALLGGTLVVRSTPGKGATVTLELPRGRQWEN